MALSLLGSETTTHCESLASRPAAELKEFLQFLKDNGLAPLWFERLHRQDLVDELPDAFIEGLRAATIESTIVHAKQLQALRDTVVCLNAAGVPMLVIKGMALRLALYEQPQLRPALDVDLLVLPQNREQAVCALNRHGMTPVPEAASIDHEITFLHRGTAVDLHWDLFRTGRSDPGLVERMFDTAKQLHGLPAPTLLHSFYLMLTHPVITNYPLMGLSLIRLVDIHRCVTWHAPDWAGLETLLEASHTRTAAWLSLSLAKRFLDTQIPDDTLVRIAPGRWRARYLEHWIDRDLSTRLASRDLLRKLGYSLPLYDSLGDALSSSWQYLRSRKQADATLHGYETLIARCQAPGDESGND